MISNPVRYRCAVLLLWAALFMVVNPVWHAISHDHIDHHQEPSDSDTRWVQEDFCPHCDAVSQVFDLPTASDVIMSWFPGAQLTAYVSFNADLRFLLSTRLRAPPFVG